MSTGNFRNSTSALFKLDPATGERAKMTAVPFPAVGDLVLDSANNELFAISFSALYRVNMLTGVETVISGLGSTAYIPDNSNIFTNATNLSIDKSNDIAYILDKGASQQIISINLTTGIRTVLSSNTVPDGVNPFSQQLAGLELDRDNNRLFLVDNQLGVVSVDTRTGVRTIFSANDTQDSSNLFFATDLLLDKATNRLLVLDGSNRKLYGVDLTSGVRNKITDLSTLMYSQPHSMSFTTRDNQLLIADQKTGIVLLDLMTGESVIVAK